MPSEIDHFRNFVTIINGSIYQPYWRTTIGTIFNNDLILLILCIAFVYVILNIIKNFVFSKKVRL